MEDHEQCRPRPRQFRSIAMDLNGLQPLQVGSRVQWRATNDKQIVGMRFGGSQAQSFWVDVVLEGVRPASILIPAQVLDQQADIGQDRDDLLIRALVFEGESEAEDV